MKRTIQTASGIDAPKEHWKALNEIDAVSDGGVYDLYYLNNGLSWVYRLANTRIGEGKRGRERGRNIDVSIWRLEISFTF